MNTKQTEALKLALEAMEFNCSSQTESPATKAMAAIREALAEQPAQQQKEGFASPGGGYVPAIPRPMPLDWKLVPRKATPEMLKAMDECAQEGYDERLYAGMASSVYMAAWDASPVMGTLPEQPAQQQEPVAWMYQNKSTHEVSFQKHMRSFVDHGAWYEVPLYSEPLANQEKTSGSPKPAKPEALRLADAMEYDLDWCDEAAAELRRMHDLLGKANALCRIRVEEIERLKAQPEQEPVAWMYQCSADSSGPVLTQHKKDWAESGSGLWVETPLYTSPPASKPWVGLTDEQIAEIAATPCAVAGSYVHTFARAIEAKLREKNT